MGDRDKEFRSSSGSYLVADDLNHQVCITAWGLNTTPAGNGSLVHFTMYRVCLPPKDVSYILCVSNGNRDLCLGNGVLS